MDAGFKSSRKFSKRLHLWDLLDRVHAQLPDPLSAGVASEVGMTVGLGNGVAGGRRMSEGGASTAPSHEEDCRDLFHKAISRINSNNPNIGKDEKVRCSSYSLPLKARTLISTLDPSHFDLCSEVVLFLEVKNIGRVWERSFLSQSALYLFFPLQVTQFLCLGLRYV